MKSEDAEDAENGRRGRRDLRTATIAKESRREEGFLRFGNSLRPET